MITVALPKGRTLGATLDRFARAGLVPEEDFSTTRKLIVPAGGAQARFVLLKDPDVPLYVERGAADLGVCGLDHVLESGADLLVPIDLGFGACRLSLAAPRASAFVEGWHAGETGGAEVGRSVRVATKYPRLTARAFARRGVPVDIVRLSGSVELAAVANLADAIVDLVETGRTLEQNGLAVVEDLLQVTARLVVNRASYRLALEELLPVLERLGAPA
ncbi:MAG TPA: ATP phosphoribosyltransferase [Myxococcales bacterium]|nr:ATP phosphoribosyltransferase [Myxococcales bacterium]